MQDATFPEDCIELISEFAAADCSAAWKIGGHTNPYVLLEELIAKEKWFAMEFANRDFHSLPWKFVYCQ